MEGIFFKPKEEYTNKLNPIKGYLEQLTQFIKIKKNCSDEEASNLAKQLIRKNFKDKVVKYFNRDDNGDRIVEDGSLIKYIMNNVNSGNILVPTFTSYVSSTVKRSILSEFIEENVKIRSIAKKESQKAKAEGKLDLAESKNNEQNNKKIYNNALSGLFGQSACILYNPTAHSTLTSITRTITSLTNACNERMIAGNRYLPRPGDVLRSVVYESTYTDQETIKQAVEEFGLHLPSVEEVVGVLRYSSDLYFNDERYYQRYVIPYLKGLTPYQLAAICYVGDLYQQRKFNEALVRQIFTELTTVINADGEKLDDPSVLYTIPEATLYYVHTLMSSKLRGKGKDYNKINELGLAKSLYLTSLHVAEVLEKYKNYFKALFMTPIIPINSHRLRNMRRRTVVLSDTDSSAFTMDEWVKWWSGKFEISDRSIGLAGSLTYLAAGNIVNQLAILSRSMNIEDKLLNTLAMKNEFLWTLHVPAESSKHYYAYTVIQEGNVFAEPEAEIKGVHLKNSAVPVSIVKRGENLMHHILHTVHTNKKLKLRDILVEVIDIENTVIDSVMRGEAIYLKKTKIKDATAYAQGPEKSPYQRHTLWVDVFQPSYGSIPEPPYDVVKLPTTVTSKTALNEWLASIEDVNFRSRLDGWLKTHKKNTLPTLYLNESYVQGKGIPKEMASVVNVKQIVFDTTLQLRVILETLGIMLNADLLVKEQFNIDPETNEVKEIKEFRWGSRTKGYEVSTKGDKRFSALVAKMPDGRSIEMHYQCDIKGYQPGGTDWRLGKGKPALDPSVDLWTEYLNLWRTWAMLNPDQLEELRYKATEHGCALNDIFANSEINQARALCVILNETRHK